MVCVSIATRNWNQSDSGRSIHTSSHHRRQPRAAILQPQTTDLWPSFAASPKTRGYDGPALVSDARPSHPQGCRHVHRTNSGRTLPANQMSHLTASPRRYSAVTAPNLDTKSSSSVTSAAARVSFNCAAALAPISVTATTGLLITQATANVGSAI
jgi:hypothetical protein